MKKTKCNIVFIILITLVGACQQVVGQKSNLNNEILYMMPGEDEAHEGTWLQWPHQHQYGKSYRNSLDAVWISMTKELVSSENVHIIVFNQKEQNRIVDLLVNSNISLSKIDFYQYKTDDVWARDNGPIYVRNKSGKLIIEDWGFNAWGKKIDDITGHFIKSDYCNSIPAKISVDQHMPLIDLNSIMIKEGGSVEIDGNGTDLPPIYRTRS